MNIRDAKCPRCGGTTFRAHFTGLIDLTLNAALEEGQFTSEVYPWPDGASDTFVDLACAGCQLTLANEGGETRLRRAYLYANEAAVVEQEPLQWDHLADTEPAPARVWYEGMMAIAERLCDEVPNLDTEVINEVVPE